MPTATCWAHLRQRQRQIRADPAGTGQGQGFIDWRGDHHPRHPRHASRNLLAHLPPRSGKRHRCAGCAGGAGYNSALGTNGLDVLLGGGRQFFLTTKDGGKRADGRDLIAEMKAKSYAYASKSEFDAIDASKTDRLLGLFTSSHMSYDLDRDPAKEPSLAEMTTKAMDVLGKNNKGYFLMVEGGRIDHALHETTAKKALQDTVAFDNAIKAAIAKARVTDPDLKNTLIVVTADHDHTLVLNGYAKRTGKTTASEAGVLGVVKDYVTGAVTKDNDGAPYSIIGFGNGENRTQSSRSAMASLDNSVTSANTYHQEAVVRVSAGNETHGGTDVFLGAIGKGADTFNGTIDNTVNVWSSGRRPLIKSIDWNRT
jgi:alkaline phosphatase